MPSPGSIPEEDDGKLYNTCMVFGPDGQLILKHRKVFVQQSFVPHTPRPRVSAEFKGFSSPLQIHLFDIDVPGKIRFQESETLSPGNSLSMFETRKWHLLVGLLHFQLNQHRPNCLIPPAAFCKVGVGICYDMRFAELAQLYSRKGERLMRPASTVFVWDSWWGCSFTPSGCQLLVYPGAFNMTTGPAHWELLQRGRSDWDTQKHFAPGKHLLQWTYVGAFCI